MLEQRTRNFWPRTMGEMTGYSRHPAYDVVMEARGYRELSGWFNVRAKALEGRAQDHERHGRKMLLHFRHSRPPWRSMSRLSPHALRVSAGRAARSTSNSPPHL